MKNSTSFFLGILLVGCLLYLDFNSEKYNDMSKQQEQYEAFKVKVDDKMEPYWFHLVQLFIENDIYIDYSKINHVKSFDIIDERAAGRYNQFTNNIIIDDGLYCKVEILMVLAHEVGHSQKHKHQEKGIMMSDYNYFICNMSIEQIDQLIINHYKSWEKE